MKEQKKESTVEEKLPELELRQVLKSKEPLKEIQNIEDSCLKCNSYKI